MLEEKKDTLFVGRQQFNRDTSIVKFQESTIAFEKGNIVAFDNHDVYMLTNASNDDLEFKKIPWGQLKSVRIKPEFLIGYLLVGITLVMFGCLIWFLASIGISAGARLTIYAGLGAPMIGFAVMCMCFQTRAKFELKTGEILVGKHVTNHIMKLKSTGQANAVPVENLPLF